MRKRILSTLLALCMVLGMLPETAWTVDARTSGTCGENLSWTLSGNGTLSISGYGPMTEFFSGNTVPWHEYARSDIKVVIIDENVTTIGRAAFADCQELVSITIPSTVTSIGELALRNCYNLKEITIPGGVTTMGSNIFEGCNNLKSAGPIGSNSDIQYGWTKEIPANAFASAKAIATVVILDGIETIGAHAFAFTSITSISLPNTVTTIGESSFASTKLVEVVLPENVTSIGENAFEWCSNLSNIALPANISNIGSNAFWDTAYYKNSANWENDVLYIGNSLIRAKTSVSGDYHIKQGTTCIADQAFDNGRTAIYYDSLTSVIMPSSITHIGRNAFSSCLGSHGFAGVYFKGNAPAVYDGGTSEKSFYDHTNLFYIEGTEGWDTGGDSRWHGYPIATWEENPCQHVYGEWVVIKEATPTTGGQRERVCSLCGNKETAIIPATGGSGGSLASIISLYPANGSTFDHVSTSNDTRMRIFFDRDVSNGGGNRPELDFSAGTLEVHKASDDSLVYRVQYGTEVSLWNVDGRPTAVVLQNATTALDYDTEYYVTMPEGFIKLADGAVSPAVDKGNWIFTTKSQQIVEPPPAPGAYAFDWNENQTPIQSLSDNLVITMTALAKLGYSTFEQNYKNHTVSEFILAGKYSELFDKENPTDVIWEIDGEPLGSYSQFYRAVIGDYIIYDYCDKEEKSGFYAVCFKSPDGKYIISYRGSEGDNMILGLIHNISETPNDWSTDFAFATRNALSSQFVDALNFYNSIEQVVGAENIVLTGHSLGGALAAYVSLCTGTRAYVIDGAVGHVIDASFWDSFWTIYSFAGANSLNFVNLTDELWASPVGDAIQATKLNKYPMVTYESIHSADATQSRGPLSLFAVVAGSHHPFSYLTYNPSTNRYILGKPTMIYNCNEQWKHDIQIYAEIFSNYLSSSKIAPELKNIFGGLSVIPGCVQIGTTGNDIIKAPSIFGVNSFSSNRQFGGNGTDALTGYSSADVLVSKGNGSVLDGQGGSDIYFIDDECRYTIIDDPGGNDTIILRNWDFDSITVQDTGGEFIRITDSHRLVTVNKKRSIFSKNKIEVLWTNNTCSQTKTVCPDLIQEAEHNQNRMEPLSLGRSTSEASAIRLIVVEGTAEISIYNSDKNLISDTIFSNKKGDSTVYADYAYYYGYNNDTDDRPYAVLYLFNDGYTVNISSAGNISAALYQYNDLESELVAGSYIENLVVPEAQTLAIVSDGFDEGFYLVEGDNGTKIDDPVSFIYAQSVSLSQTNINLKIGSSIALFANATPIDAIIDGNWYSFNQDVATVDGNGRVTACGIGSAEINFVSINGKTASCNVTVISTGNSGEVNDSPNLPGNEHLYSDNDSSKYIISVPSVSGGKISVNPSRASKGTTVTLTATPDNGYELTSLTVKYKNGGELPLTDKGSGQYTFIMPGGAVTIDAVFSPISDKAPEAPSLPFTDVPPAEWFYSSVQYVYTHGLMTGTTPTTFSPDAPMTRAMAWTLLGRLAGADVDGGTPWYANAQTWAISGSVSDGSDPDGNITREQLVTMLYRQAGSPAASADLTGFVDSGLVSDWAAPAVQWAVAAGLLKGDNGRLNPNASASRAEVAALLTRFCENIMP